VVTIEVTSGAAPMTLRVRVPAWAAAAPLVRLNGAGIRVPAVADGKPVTLIPVARAHHQHYTVCWQTADLPTSPGPAPARSASRPAPGPVT
jgi:hypothetical protein